jgi:hypothetical protein
MPVLGYAEKSGHFVGDDGLNLCLSIRRGSKWTHITADYNRQLHGEKAVRAGLIVIGSVVTTLFERRRQKFIVGMGNGIYEITPCDVHYTYDALGCLIRDVGLPGSTFVTVCPVAGSDWVACKFKRLLEGVN